MCKYKLWLAVKLLTDVRYFFFRFLTLHERTIFSLCAIADVVDGPECNAIVDLLC